MNTNIRKGYPGPFSIKRYENLTDAHYSWAVVRGGERVAWNMYREEDAARVADLMNAVYDVGYARGLARMPPEGR